MMCSCFLKNERPSLISILSSRSKSLLTTGTASTTINSIVETPIKSGVFLKIRKEVRNEIELQEKFKEFKKNRVIPEESREEKIKNLQAKLEPLKLILNRVKVDPAKVMMLNQQISFLENKLNELLQEGLMPPEVVKEEVKHTLLFDAKGFVLPSDIDVRLERELPLPPPPKMRR